MPTDGWIENNAPWMPNMLYVAENHVHQLGYDPIGFEHVSSEFKQEMMPFVLEMIQTDKPIKDILDSAQEEMTAWAESIDMPQ
jgi:hypothetical protein